MGGPYLSVPGRRLTPIGVAVGVDGHGRFAVGVRIERAAKRSYDARRGVQAGRQPAFDPTRSPGETIAGDVDTGIAGAPGFLVVEEHRLSVLILARLAQLERAAEIGAGLPLLEDHVVSVVAIQGLKIILRPSRHPAPQPPSRAYP